MEDLERCADTSPIMQCCGTTSWWEMFANHAGIDVLWHCADDGSDDMTLGVGDFVANFWHETFSTERVDGRTYSSMATLLLRLAVTLHACDNDESFIHDTDGFALWGRAFLDGAVTRDAPGVSVMCPVSEIAGGYHLFVRGSGVVVPWSVMGDNRDSVEVCAECASRERAVRVQAVREGFASDFVVGWHCDGIGFVCEDCANRLPLDDSPGLTVADVEPGELCFSCWGLLAD